MALCDIDHQTTLPASSQTLRALSCGASGRVPTIRRVPAECAVAFVYQGTSEAVMMATPDDLEDLALGFSLTEGIAGSPDDIADIAIASSPAGIELRIWLTPDRARAYTARRRRLAGPTGCGLCGIESLADALRPMPALPDVQLP